MDEKILTQHPEGKTGVKISKTKYDQMRNAIIDALHTGGEMSFTELNAVVGAQLEGNFDGSIGWYFTTVKLDLEARGIVERLTNRTPQQIRLVETTS